MASTDTVCTLVPHFRVNPGQIGAFRARCDQFVAKTRSERGCVHDAFSFDGDAVHCREGCDDAAAVLAHLDHVGALRQEALKIAPITRLEVHAPPAELDKLRAPLAGLKPQFFGVEYGLRR
jgi:quinol monooxygenase YgiN